MEKQPVNISELLTPEEVAFVKMVYQCPGFKLDSKDCFCRIDNGTEYGESHALWDKPEELGMITSVGSYKWVPLPGLEMNLCFTPVDPIDKSSHIAFVNEQN